MAQQKIQLRSVDKAECVKSDMRSLKATFSFSTIDAQDFQSERGTFSWLTLPNTVIGGNEGDPQIPVVNELIAVPFGAQPWVEITSYSTTDYRLEDYGMKTLVPRQPSLRKDKNPEEVPFVYNEAAYQSTRGFRSEPMAVVNVVGTMRGVQLGKMTIEPVSYDPVNNTMRVFNDIEVTVHFDGADAVATEKMLVDTYSPYFDGVYGMLFNGRAVRDAYSAHPDLYTTPVKMLVVATSAYQSSTAFQNWLTWKKQKGIDVDIYTVTSSTASSTIQSEIYSRYNANHPTFLVIVGDETVVKAYKTNWSCGSTYGNCINDLEYASVDGDVYHDMFMSRMSVSSTTELGNLVDKILTYEKYTMSTPSYLDNSLLIAGWDSSWTNRVGKPTIQYANNNYYNSDHGINPTVYITTGSGQTAAYNNINNVGFMNYTAHGDIQELADPEFTNSNANSMTNNGKYLWIVANCCLTANWGNSTYKPCLGETLIRAANKGAFGYIGSIPESYWYEDYYFGVGAFPYVASTVQTTSSTTTGMYDALFDDTGFNTLNSVPYIGNVAVTYAHAAGYTSSVTDEYYWRAYQCLGDGSVMPYLNNPSANSVSHASTINIGATTFQVSAHAGSYVAITKNNEILGVAQVPSSGIVNVPISGLTTSGDVMIVVTRHQRQPYITTIQAVSTSGPYITLDSFTPIAVLVGQNTNLSLTFKNVGNTATSGTTTVTLSSSDTHVSIPTPTQTFGTLAANATTTVNGFRVLLNSGVTLGSPVTLHYAAVNGSNTWEGDFTLTPDQIFTVDVAPNNNNYGSVSGGGQFHYGESCTVTATPADGYMFSNWTNNGSVVATTAQYTFSVSGNMNLVATFTQGVMIGDGGSSTSQYLPTFNYYNYSLTEQIYTSAELGGAGTITSIAFYNEGAEKTRTLDFYLKTTTKSSFSSKTDWITVSSGDKVFSGSVTMVANDWTTITFSNPFIYDGTSNLVLVTDDNTGEYTSSPHMACRVFNASGNQTIYIYSDGTNYNPSSPTTSQSSNYAVLSVKNQLIVAKEAASTEPVNITVNVSPANAGVVSGGGEYTIGSTCTVTATPNTGYTFTNWTKNGVSVSTNPTYSFTVTGAATLVANFTINRYNVTATPLPTEGGSVAIGSRNRDDLYYDFEDGWQGWTAIKGNSGTSTHNWMHNTEYTAYDSNGSLIVPVCHNSSSGMMLSESYISAPTAGGSGQAVTPDNYLVSPQFRLGGSISFYAASRMSNYPAEKFSVLVSESGNTSTSNFTHTELTVTLSNTDWNEYTVDLSAYSGMGYVAIRHYDCNDQHLLYIDDVTIVEGIVDDGSESGTFNYGASCTVTATPNTGYYFVNWTENGSAVSADPSYTFTVTGDRDLVANFSEQQQAYVVTATANPTNGGTVTGGGSFEEGELCTLTATANTGYTFSNWTKNGIVVSTDATYTFNVAASGTYVANFTVIPQYTITILPDAVEHGSVTFGSKANRDELVYDFEDGWQGWTTFQGNTTSPNSWMHNTEYPTSNNNFSTGYGYNNSDGFMLSESYISGSSSGSGTAVTPDNYLVSPQVLLGGSISFYAGARNTSYCAEKFSVMVSTTGNTDAASFTTVGTWTLSLSSAGYNSTPYTVDLSDYSGMGYIAIRHFDCYDQWFLAVDNVTIVEGEVDDGSISDTFEEGQSCTVTAMPNEGYYFTSWTENGTVVSSEDAYTFTVDSDRELVANFTNQPPTSSQTVNLPQGASWWSTNLDITLDDLKAAIAEALGSTGTATIKSQTGYITYSNGQWSPSSSMTFDLGQMYMIQVSATCTFTLTGVPVDPSDYVITIHQGATWIGFPSGESMTVTAAFAGLNPENGDVVKGKMGNATFNGTSWIGGLTTLEPGQGYIYLSNATGDKTFTYGNNSNKK